MVIARIGKKLVLSIWPQPNPTWRQSNLYRVQSGDKVIY